MINKYPDSELTGKIIGCAMEVHGTLGNACRTGRAFRKGFINVVWRLR